LSSAWKFEAVESMTNVTSFIDLQLHIELVDWPVHKHTSHISTLNSIIKSTTNSKMTYILHPNMTRVHNLISIVFD